MASLTIRNISATPLQLLKTERFSGDAVESVHGISDLVWSILLAPYKLISGYSGDSEGAGLVPKAGAAATATDAIEGGALAVAPFAACKTAVKAPDATQEVLRLTLKAAFQGGGSRTYTVDVPGASPRSITLQPVDGGEGEAAQKAAFTAVYSVAGAHLAIMSSAALSSWMATVDGAWPISSLSLPGTHNSPAYHYALPSVRCQAVDVRSQLDNGVRFLDVRVSVNPTGEAQHPHADPRRLLTLVHSVFPIGLLGAHHFDELYDAVCAFLDANPSETVLISLKREGTGKGSDEDLAQQLLQNYIGGPSAEHQPPNAQRWYTESRVPSLNDVRGRIVLIRRFRLPDNDTFKQLNGGAGWGIDGSVWPDNCSDGVCGTGLMRLQDYYDVTQTTSIPTKISYVHALLENAGKERYSKGGNGMAAAAVPSSPAPPLFINFLTGSNFFNMRCWPENVAAHVNPSVVEYLCVRHCEAADGAADGAAGVGATGVVVTDWVGYRDDWDLIRCIVAWNARLQMA